MNLWRSIVFSRLSQLRGGHVTVVEKDQSTRFGDSTADLRVTIKVLDVVFFRKLVLGGGLGAAESLMDGDWSCDSLTDLVRIFVRNWKIASGLEAGLAKAKHLSARIGYALRRNWRGRARQNIHEHYDLGNAFFALFLDETLSYSCGLFQQPQDSMLDASLAKLDRVCRMLELGPSDHLLEIGTGWGGLAIHAAKHFGCRVTTTTISREQFDVATRRVSQAGLDERITVLLQDYRDVEGEYDKLVSIEMLEAVGHQFFDTFFQKCNGLLKPQGAMLLQSITIRDQFYQQHLRSVDFIRKYIFPGGCLPSVATILQSTSRVSDLHLVDQVDIGEHYVLTLQRWREAFWSKIDEVRRLGYSERFIRMWDYYFCYCEGAFAEKQVSDVQMLFAKRLSPLRGIRFQTFGDAFVHDRENCLAYSTRAAQ